MKRKQLLSTISFITAMAMLSSCGTAERNNTGDTNPDIAQTTSASVTLIDELDIETDWESVMKVCDDMIDPEKFGFVFDNSLGFSDEFSAILTGGEESLYDGPIYYGSSYTHLRDANYNTIEAYLNEYRELFSKAEIE